VAAIRPRTDWWPTWRRPRATPRGDCATQAPRRSPLEHMLHHSLATSASPVGWPRRAVAPVESVYNFGPHPDDQGTVSRRRIEPGQPDPRPERCGVRQLDAAGEWQTLPVQTARMENAPCDVDINGPARGRHWGRDFSWTCRYSSRLLAAARESNVSLAGSQSAAVAGSAGPLRRKVEGWET